MLPPAVSPEVATLKLTSEDFTYERRRWMIGRRGRVHLFLVSDRLAAGHVGIDKSDRPCEIGLKASCDAVWEARQCPIRLSDHRGDRLRWRGQDNVLDAPARHVISNVAASPARTYMARPHADHWCVRPSTGTGLYVMTQT